MILYWKTYIIVGMAFLYLGTIAQMLHFLPRSFRIYYLLQNKKILNKAAKGMATSLSNGQIPILSLTPL